jgi:tRNA-2-methylthio-N6-dimethylallyladenosine synthase
MPFVDVVIVGPDNLHELPALVRDAEMGAAQAVRTVFDVDAPRFLTNHVPRVRRSAPAPSSR